MSAFTSLLGEKLQSANGEVSTAEALAGKKAVGLYFSAHWCPPCRQFTPMLGGWYTKDLKAKGLEVVFVSSDRDEESFKEYFGEQPWLALPFAERKVKAALSKKYKVQGIPSFVILDGETGETITTDGRDAVSEDPSGASFPWKPPSFWESLGSEFLQGMDGETVDLDELKAGCKYIGLYFSAHWCPPCRQFTPALIKAYNDHLKAKGLEIIFVSSDRSAAEFTEYYGTMPWLAIPNGDARKKKLDKLFGVQGIPTFALIDANTGETVSANARGRVSMDPEGKEFPWLPKPITDMAVENPEGINEEATLVVLLEGCEEPVRSAAVAVLEEVAKERKAAGEEMLFMYASRQGRVCDQIRQLAKVGSPDKNPKLLLLDIPDEGGYYLSPATTVTKDTLTTFIEGFKAKVVERKQLGG